MKGTDVPGLTFDAILLLSYEWFSKYMAESLDTTYERIARGLGYSDSSIVRYRRFFTDGLASIGWLQGNHLSKEAIQVLSRMKTSPFSGSVRVDARAALPKHRDPTFGKVRRTTAYYLDFEMLLKMRAAISRNPCIKGILRVLGHPRGITKGSIEEFLTESNVFSRNKSTIPRRASDVLNWIGWLKDSRAI